MVAYAFAGSLRATRAPMRAEWTKPGAHPAHRGSFFWQRVHDFLKNNSFSFFTRLFSWVGDASGGW